MFLFISILIVIAAILLIFFVVVQNSKGGGLASGFSSSNQVMGVRKTTDFLEKATWGLAGAIVVLAVFSTFFVPGRNVQEQESEIKQEIQNAVPINPNATSPFGTPIEQPQQQPAQP
ncbi:MAG: preprotein translocase subunit SecG [Dysgonamonadaceae bacterium]|jgi:preprotein translocase subunit SecG|nr:preprotein translocase subunit SecG [Dysgonamonadaceae bacterium]